VRRTLEALFVICVVGTIVAVLFPSWQMQDAYGTGYIGLGHAPLWSSRLMQTPGAAINIPVVIIEGILGLVASVVLWFVARRARLRELKGHTYWWCR